MSILSNLLAKAAPSFFYSSPPTPELKKTLHIELVEPKDWEDVAGSDVYINTANYQNTKETYFEVSLHIPTKNGVMFARLYNVTDKHPVWYSEVHTDQDVSTFLSSKISLDPGNKQYRIQLKTTLEYQSLLDNARIKIISN